MNRAVRVYGAVMINWTAIPTLDHRTFTSTLATCITCTTCTVREHHATNALSPRDKSSTNVITPAPTNPHPCRRGGSVCATTISSVCWLPWSVIIYTTHPHHHHNTPSPPSHSLTHYIHPPRTRTRTPHCTHTHTHLTLSIPICVVSGCS